MSEPRNESGKEKLLRLYQALQHHVDQACGNAAPRAAPREAEARGPKSRLEAAIALNAAAEAMDKMKARRAAVNAEANATADPAPANKKLEEYKAAVDGFRQAAGALFGQPASEDLARGVDPSRVSSGRLRQAAQFSRTREAAGNLLAAYKRVRNEPVLELCGLQCNCVEHCASAIVSVADDEAVYINPPNLLAIVSPDESRKVRPLPSAACYEKIVGIVEAKAAADKAAADKAALCRLSAKAAEEVAGVVEANLKLAAKNYARFLAEEAAQ